MNLETKLGIYHMSESSEGLIRNTPLLLIASVVGGGKDTVVKELVKSGGFHRIVSHTTRSPRTNHGVTEQNGHDYHFISVNEAEQMLDDQLFIEAKYVHGNVYGTSVAEVAVANSEHKTAVTDIDVQGVVEYLEVKPDTHAVFLLPPSVDTWLQRLATRYGNLDDHQEELKKRFTTAYNEIMHIQNDPRFVLVINDDLDTTAERVKGVLDRSVDHTSEYAEAVTEHLLDFLSTKI